VFSLVFASAHAQTQAPPATAKIVEIKVSGTSRFTSEQIAAAIGIKIGDTVGKTEIQAAADRLAALGNFAAVNYHFTTDERGLRLAFEVQEAPTVPVLFDNFPWFTDDELSAAIRQAIGYFDGTSPQQGAILDSMAASIEKLLATRGVHGKVIHTLTGYPGLPGDVIQFSVSGAPVKLQVVEFGDSLAAKSVEVTARLNDVTGHPYSRLALAVFALEEVRPVYLSAGFLKVSFGQPTASLTPAPDNPKEMVARVFLPVIPGSQFQYAGVTWSGNAAYSPTALNSMVRIATGAVADGIKLQGTWQAISLEYGHVGYLDASLNAKETYDDAAAKVSYLVTITEGPQYHMGDLVITGLSLDAEKKLRQLWALAPGAVFDQSYFEAFIRKIGRPTPDIFGKIPVHYDKVGQMLQKDDPAHIVKVFIDFQ
jgi:outer membrane protein assembly factor BamA